MLFFRIADIVFRSSKMAFADLQACANWIIVEGTDIEVRHTLFTNELGGEWRDNRSYQDGN
jgi:hypothetical protein